MSELGTIDLVLFYFSFSFFSLFYFIFEFLFLFFIFGHRQRREYVTSQISHGYNSLMLI